MQAAVFHGDKKIRSASAPGRWARVLWRQAYCPVRSDTKLWIKGAEFTPGHEIFGVVEQPGHAKHGKRCLVYIPVHCGRCDEAPHPRPRP
jgi:propanol-preferring alcohol dehydrogenase